MTERIGKVTLNEGSNRELAAGQFRRISGLLNNYGATIRLTVESRREYV